MSLSYSNLNPEASDSVNVLLRKILQRLGTLASGGDTEATLLAKILAALNTAASASDGVNSSGDLSVTPIWTDGATHTGLKVNVTDTSAASDSRYVDFQVGGTSKFYIDKANGFVNIDAISVLNNFVLVSFSDASNNSSPVALEVYHNTTSGTPTANNGVSIDFRADSDTTERQLLGRLSVAWSNATHATRTSFMTFQPLLNGVGTEALHLSNASADLKNGCVLHIASTQVVGARKTGWSTATGTPTRSTFDTATVTLPQLAERVKALIDDLHATAGHGLIGT